MQEKAGGMGGVKLATSIEPVYRYMMHSHEEEWGDHPWRDWAMNIHRWDWNPGVAILAAMEYFKVTDRREVLNEIVCWVNQNEPPFHGGSMVINSVAPFAVYPDLFRVTADESYKQTAMKIADWLIERAPRTKESAFEHTVTESEAFREQVWADTVFMAVVFLARSARLFRDEHYAQEAASQLLVHYRLLQDVETNLFFHGYNCSLKSHMSAARWTRANAWMALGTPMIYREIQGLCEVPQEIGTRYREMMQAIRAVQRDDGLWPTVLDRPDYVPETSGSAGIACGIIHGISQGLLDDSFRECALNAAEGVSAQIGADGRVSGVSGGTPVLASVDDYNRVPVFPTLYGQGLVLMLLTTLHDERTRS
ncbi:glycosyl hydrolase [Paenibacillus faecis]|uniref:Glycosyl hydrolase n=1 Tax=Paenibacillus faecis TaxID=862114 RepID=A0A5D0CKB9_9BACL|nr:glycosyl hydrolase [Paenibacillus faecis]